MFNSVERQIFFKWCSTMSKIKSFLKSELYDLKNGLNKWEYLLWWAIRIAVIVMMCRRGYDGSLDDTQIFLMSMNLLASFTVPLVRLILIPKRIFTKVPFRCQTYLNIMVFASAFIGQGFRLNWSDSSWDKFLHVLSGALVVFIGFELVKGFTKGSYKIPDSIITFTSVGFSFIGIVLWEIFEFFADYYWKDSNNQAYNLSPERDMFFIKIFGYGVQNENQWAVFDTNVDMICAVFGIIVSTVILTLALKKKSKNKIKETEKETVAA